MNAIKFGCPECGSTLALDPHLAANTSIHCPDCNAIFSIEESTSPSKRMPRRPKPSATRSAPSSTPTFLGVRLLVAFILIGGLFLVMAAVAVAGIAAYYRWTGKTPPGGIAIGPLGIAAGNPAVNKASLDKLDAGMTLEEVQAILGTGRRADKNEMKVAFAEGQGYSGPREPPSDTWMRNGQNCGVESWYQWQNGNESIFVGFAKGKKSGKDRALACFWVQSFSAPGGAHGFESDVGFYTSTQFGDPDSIAKSRKDEERLLNDPKWNRGNPRQLLIGRWQDVLQSGYEFRADGSFQTLEPFGYTSTYRFVNNDHIEITIPGANLLPPGPQAKLVQYRVLISQDELILLQPGPRPVPMRYKRVRS